MGRSIDERIVEMRFDNKQFEAGVQTSLSTLDKLKKSLNLEGAAKGFEQIDTAAKKCDMSVLGRAVETVQVKFSAFEVVAMTTLSNIANSAVNAGKRLLSSLTVEPISSGFSEYELKMGSIQTIMASTGESLDRVNQKLDELNKYSDRTIYSFSDMTTNIGKFTNAGVKLDDAVAAIQGVSNVAAVSGANANEASRAMYNFAQALSAGYVKLIDWKSIENANMATVEFKNQLLEAAVAAGTVRKTANGMYQVLTKNAQGSVMKETIDATHMFNDSLSYQWMTTKVLTSTLKDYADETTEIGKKAFAAAQDVKTWTQLLDTLKESAQSGWAETWQLVAGDYEEAKATLRTFSEFFSSIIDGSADARNSLLEGALMSSWGQIKNRVNETGISVDEFREALRETAEESVDGLDKMIEEAGSFDAALSKGWLTTGILSDTLDNLVSKAAGTQVSISKLSNAQLQNIGYTKDQVEALRTLSKEAKTSDSNLASLVSTLDRQSGRELLFDSLLNGAKAVQKIFQTLKGAWNDIFPPATSQQLSDLIAALHSFSEKLIISDDMADRLGRTVKGLFAVLDLIGQAFSAVLHAVSPLFGGLGRLSGGILNVTASFGDWLVKLDETAKKSDIFNRACQRISGFLDMAKEKVLEFGAALGTKLGFPGLDTIKASVQALLGTLKEKIGAPGLEFLRDILDGLCVRAGQARDVITDFLSRIDGAAVGKDFFQVLSGIWTLIKQIAGEAAGLLGKGIKGLINAVSGADFNGILDVLNALTAGGIIAAIRKFIDPLEELESTFTSFKDWAKGLGEGVTKILDGARGSLEAWQTKLKSDALARIAMAVGILSASLLVLSSIDSEKLTVSLAAMTAMLVELSGSLILLDATEIDGRGANKTASAMIKIGAALLILSEAMKNIAGLNPEQLAEGLIAVGVLLGELDVFLNTAKFDKKTSKTATGMILMAAAIKVLSSVVKTLGGMNWEDMAKGLAGVGVLLAEVDVFLNTAKFSGKSVSTATGIVILSSAIKILASACEDFGAMSWKAIAKGLTSIAGLLVEIAAFTKLTGNAKHVISTGLALIEIGAAMKIFASAMTDFSKMSREDIGKGLTSMGGALAEVAIAVKLMPKNMVGVGVGLIAVGGALEILADVLGKMGGMSWESIGKGLAVLGGALAELSIALNLMKGALAGSAAVLVAAGALAVLTPVMLTLGGMSWESIAKGLIAIAGAFTVMGVAGAVLGPLAPSILAISGALALLGVGSVAIGAGLTLIGTGLTSIAVGLTSLAASFASSGTLIVGGLSAIVLGFAGLIPAIAEKLGEAILVLCGVITQGAPAIGEAVKAVVLTLVDVLTACVPAIADGALQLVAGVLASLVAYTPQIIDSLLQFLIEIINGVAQNLPKLASAISGLVAALVGAIIDELMKIDSEAFTQGLIAAGLLAAAIAAFAAIGPLIPSAMTGVLGAGAVIAEAALVLTAIGGLAQIPGLTWLVNEGGALLADIGSAIGGFAGELIGSFAQGLTNQLPVIGQSLGDFMTNAMPFIDGAAKINPSILGSVAALAGAILEITGGNLVRGVLDWFSGGSSIEDFGNALADFGGALAKYSNTVSGNIDADSVASSVIAGTLLAKLSEILPKAGEIMDTITGQSNFDSFGTEMQKFGDAIVLYSNTVADKVNVGSVASSVMAGTLLAKLSEILPKAGEIMDTITGQSNFDSFGTEMQKFGDAIVLYSNTVADKVNVGSVASSVMAGTLLAKLSEVLPKAGEITDFFTGRSNFDSFGTEMQKFGDAIVLYSNTVADKVNVGSVASSVIAGTLLAKLSEVLPKAGEITDFFTGRSNFDSFGTEMQKFGDAIVLYSDTVADKINVGSVASSLIAGTLLAKLSEVLPKAGEITDFFTGRSNFDSFGTEMQKFGNAVVLYSDTVADKINVGSVASSVMAGTLLAKLSEILPKAGEIMDTITGQSNFDSFGTEMQKFGDAIVLYSNTVADKVNVGSVASSVMAGTLLAKLSEVLPKAGEITDFFTGRSNFDSFGTEMQKFGDAIVLYSNTVADKVNVGSVASSVMAGTLLAKLSEVLPKAGEITDFFTGRSNFDSFGTEMQKFGNAIVLYSDTVADKINVGSVASSVIAGTLLAKLSEVLPKAGEITDFFTGRSNFDIFGQGVNEFAEAITAYSEKVKDGLNTDNIDLSVAAGESLAGLWEILPDVGKMYDFFTGKSDFDLFGEGITSFAEAITAYSEKVKDGLNTDNIDLSVAAGESLAGLWEILPDVGEMYDFFTGKSDFDVFGEGITSFAEAITAYSEKVKDGLNTDNIDLSVAAGESLAGLWEILPDVGEMYDFFTGKSDFGVFGEGITSFAEAITAYSEKVKDGLNTDNIDLSVAAGESLVALADILPKTGGVIAFFTGGNDFEAFGKGITEYAAAITGYSAEVFNSVDNDAVGASIDAGSALVELSNILPDNGGQTLEKFGKIIVKLGGSIADYCTKMAGIDPAKLTRAASQVRALMRLAEDLLELDASGLTAFNDALKNMGNTGVSAFIAAFEDPKGQINKAVEGMLTAVSRSITDGKNLAVPGMDSVIKALADAVSEGTPEVQSSFAAMIKGAAGTIRNKIPTVKSAIDAVLSAINSKLKEFETAGKNAGQGFIKGIKSKLKDASGAGKSIAEAALNAAKKALDSHSPSRKFITLGSNSTKGYAIGVKNGTKDAASSAKGLAEAALDAASTGTDFKAAGKDDAEAYAQGLREGAEEAETVTFTSEIIRHNAANDRRFGTNLTKERVTTLAAAATNTQRGRNYDKKWMDDWARKNGFGSLEELLAEIEWAKKEGYIAGGMQSESGLLYLPTTKQDFLPSDDAIRAAAEAQIEAEEKVIEERDEAKRKEYENSMNWIEEEKYYGRMSLSDELAAYKRVQSRYAKGTEERKKMDREVYRLEKEIYEAKEQYVQDIQAVEQQAIEDRKQAIEDHRRQVEEVNKELADGIDELNEKYQNAVESREKSLYQSYGLFDEVGKREQVSGEKLMSNLEDQVKEFGQWQDILSNLGARGLDEELMDELKQMGPAAIGKLEALNRMSDTELTKYASLWSVKHAQAREQAVSELVGLREDTDAEIEKLRQEADIKLGVLHSELVSNIERISNDAEREIDRLSRTFSKNLGLMKEDTNAKMSEMTRQANNILREAGWDESGRMAVKGLVKGVEDELPKFIQLWRDIALNPLRTIETTWDEHSPSREFDKLGRFAGMGLVNGLKAYVDNAGAAGKALAEQARDSASNALSTVSDLVENGFDIQPTVRPVIDFSEINRGAEELDGLLHSTRTIELAGQTSRAFNSVAEGSAVTVAANNDGVVRELRSLRSEMADMTARLERMRVVLDTGTVVGELAGPMDSALGQIRTYRGRGI